MQAVTKHAVLAALALVLAAAFAVQSREALAASGSGYHMEPMEPDLQNVPSLQSGMALFANYCMGCHSLQYQRYQRTANDLQIPDDVMLDNLIFTGQKIGEKMVNAMPVDASKNWFGAAPPDLTMIARVKSPEYIYNYLKTFYEDPSRPFGANNLVYPNVGMANSLLPLQGVQHAECPEGSADVNDCELVLEPGTGKYSVEEFDQAVYDIANFLYYVGEPTRLERHRIGVYVLLFLVILFVLTYLLGREYEKEVRH